MDEHDLRAFVGGWLGVDTGVKWQDELVLSVAGKLGWVLCLRGAGAKQVQRDLAD